MIITAPTNSWARTVRRVPASPAYVSRFGRPNAERVSVIGHFNQWDGRCHPMSVRGNSGVWELFIPELGADELYRYEIRNRDTGELRVKTDPYAHGPRASACERVADAASFEIRLDRRGVAAGARGAPLAPRAALDLRGALELVAPRSKRCSF